MHAYIYTRVFARIAPSARGAPRGLPRIFRARKHFSPFIFAFSFLSSSFFFSNLYGEVSRRIKNHSAEGEFPPDFPFITLVRFPSLFFLSPPVPRPPSPVLRPPSPSPSARVLFCSRLSRRVACPPGGISIRGDICKRRSPSISEFTTRASRPDVKASTFLDASLPTCIYRHLHSGGRV